MESLTTLIGAKLLDWSTEKVEDVLLNGVSSKLNSKDLDKALKKATKAAHEQQKALFIKCESGLAKSFLEQFFTGSGLQELQKPLNNQGTPQLDFLVLSFQAALKSHPEMQGRVDQSVIEPWMKVFVETYFTQTNNYLAFQVAKEGYFKQLINYFDDVKFAGIAVEGQEIEKSENLPEIFVMPDVVEDVRSRSGSEFEQELLLESISNQTELLGEQRQRSQFDKRIGRKFSATQLLSQSQSRKVVLLGAPGSGKTTSMSYLAVILALKQPEKLELAVDTDWLPILIRIRDLALQPEMSILDFARHFAEKRMQVKSLPAGFFEYWLEDGKALILLDGLDEVAQEAKRYEVVQHIENFLGQFAQNRAIITSRPAGYKRDFFRTEEFPHYELQLFDDDKIEEFINRWYDSRISDKEEAQRRKESLRKALTEQDRIKLLARNPLLLTIVALIHRYQIILPRERYKLYDKAVETLLTSWDANKELSNHTVLEHLKLDDLRRLMESLAYWIHTQGNTGDQEGGTLIDKDELIDKLSTDIKALKPIQKYEAKEEAKRFVNFIRDRTGLLNEQGQDCYAFVHKTFQEYLCSQEIDYQRDNEQDFGIVVTHIADHIHNPHWREVLLLLIAQQKPKPAAKAIRKILNQNSLYESWLHRDLLFAGSCLAENPKDLKVNDPELSKEILEKLVELEVDDSKRVGNKVHGQVFQTICRLNEGDFQEQALQLLKDRKDDIDVFRLLKYQAALGEQEEIIKTLLEKLKDQDFRLRFRAAVALGRLGNTSETVVTALLESLKDQNSAVRDRAVDALGRLGKGSEAVVTALLELLKAQNYRVRLNAANALVKSGNASETVVTALLESLKDQDSAGRYRAVDALGELDNTSETVVTALLELLKDHDFHVRLGAAEALYKLSKGSETVVAALLESLKEQDSNACSAAAFVLGKLSIASETVITTLLELLKNQDSQMRCGAAFSLGELGIASETVVTALLELLKDQDSLVRLGAAFSLGKLGNNSEGVVTTLLESLKEQDSNIPSIAAEALGKLGKKSSNIAPAVVQWIEHHQHADYVGAGIDALWDLVVGEES